MTQQEFFERTNIELTAKEYEEVERLYMAAGNMDKDTFCKEYKKVAKSQLFEELKIHLRIESSINKKQADEIRQLKEQRKQLGIFLLEEAHRMSSPTAREKAIELLGIKEYMIRTLRLGYHQLWEDDKEILIATLENITTE